MRYSLSSDGKFLATIHVDGAQGVQILSTDPVKKLQTVALPQDFFFYASMSSDNKAIFFGTKTGSDSAIWRQSLDKKTAPVKLSSLPGKTVRWIHPSPDGKSLGLIVETPQSEAVLLKDVQ